jgi:hypothetical protein
MPVSEFVIIAAIVIVGLVFILAAQKYINSDATETENYKYKAEGQDLISLLDRISMETANYVSYKQYINFCNITVDDGILTYERNGIKTSFHVSKEVSDVTLKDTTSICVSKNEDSISISDKCDCNYDGLCDSEECKVACSDCKGPKSICIGDGFCNKDILENCENSIDCKCPNGVCCPKSSDSSENGCSIKNNLTKGKECSCNNQCSTGLECRPTVGSFSGFKKACCDEKTSWDGTNCIKKTEAKLKIIFVPVNWDSSMDAFDNAASAQFDTLIKNIPLATCPEEAEMITVHNNCVLNMVCNCPDLSAMKTCADKSGEEYNYVIGLEDSDVCGSVAGFSCSMNTIFSETTTVRIVAHELGHEWGLNDEYIDSCRCGYAVDPSANCLKSELFGDYGLSGSKSDYCVGTKCPSSYPPSSRAEACLGNRNPKSGICLMSFANAPDPAAFCQECYTHLLTVPIVNC